MNLMINSLVNVLCSLYLNNFKHILKNVVNVHGTKGKACMELVTL